MRKTFALLLIGVLSLGLVWLGYSREGVSEEKEAMSPFGGKEDVAFANKLWKAMQGYDGWPMKSDFYTGNKPHGKIGRLYYGVVHVEGKPYHVIIKDNLGGEGATLEAVAKSPKKYLAAVTVIVQREAGYDPENHDRLWAKFTADGSVMKNEAGVMLAGRVAKGKEKGCIACHSGAKGKDYLFFNDKM